MGGRPLAAGTLARVHVVLRAALAQAMRWGWIWTTRPNAPTASSRASRRAASADTGRAAHPARPRRRARPAAARVARAWPRSPAPAAPSCSACDGTTSTSPPDGCRSVPAGSKDPTARCSLPPRPSAATSSTSTRQRSTCSSTSPPNAAATPERMAFVFSDDGGATAWKPNRVTKAFLRHRRAAGLRPFRLHDLRHFMATEMLHAGVPLVIVSRRLDHRRSRRPSTSTPTLSPAATPKPLPPSGRSCKQQHDQVRHYRTNSSLHRAGPACRYISGAAHHGFRAEPLQPHRSQFGVDGRPLPATGRRLLALGADPGGRRASRRARSQPGTTPANVRSRSPGCSPARPPCCRSPAPDLRAHLEDNVAAAGLRLSDDEVAALNAGRQQGLPSPPRRQIGAFGSPQPHESR